MHWELGDLGIHAGLFTHVSLVLFLAKSGFLIPLGGHYHGADSVPSKKWKASGKFCLGVLARPARDLVPSHCLCPDRSQT